MNTEPNDFAGSPLAAELWQSRRIQRVEARDQAGLQLTNEQAELKAGRAPLQKAADRADGEYAAAERALDRLKASRQKAHRELRVFLAQHEMAIDRTRAQIRDLADSVIDEFLTELANAQAELRRTDASIDPKRESRGGRKVTTAVFGDATSRDRRARAIVDLQRQARVLKDQVGIDLEAEIENLRQQLPPVEFETVQLQEARR